MRFPEKRSLRGIEFLFTRDKIYTVGTYSVQMDPVGFKKGKLKLRRVIHKMDNDFGLTGSITLTREETSLFLLFMSGRKGDPKLVKAKNKVLLLSATPLPKGMPSDDQEFELAIIDRFRQIDPGIAEGIVSKIPGYSEPGEVPGFETGIRFLAKKPIAPNKGKHYKRMGFNIAVEFTR